MSVTDAIDVGQEAIYVLLVMSAPVMLIALFVGLIIALFQALTQIQEMTLAFVPKIILVFIVLIVLTPWMYGQLADFQDQIIDRIIGLGLPA
ncbi:MAG: flagellar biosynthesis protein FliQ [Alphaproteobacteria bacterium]|nr:flagellar biosynthesis protein FliQ [Alphaproteobacteria bacterium]